MLRARLLEGSSSKAWVDKVPGIMLTLNAMPHEPHGFSALMIATGWEPTLPPDVHQCAHASPAVDDPSDYIEAIIQRLQLTHQQMASPSPPSVANPYQVGSLIYAMTTPPERASKLSPRWKGPFRVCQVPNEYQVIYEDGEAQRTIHVNHAKPTKFTAPDLPEPVPTPEPPRPPLGYLLAGLACPRPPPPASAAPAGDSSSSSAAASTAPQPAVPAESEMRSPATAPANKRPEPAPLPRRSPRLNNPGPDRACAIKSHRLGRCEVPPVSHGHAIRGIYRPLCFAMAQDDADGLCAHPPLEEYDFSVKHRPGKSQTHVDGLSRLPVDPPPPGLPQRE